MYIGGWLQGFGLGTKFKNLIVNERGNIRREGLKRMFSV
jgi:hypothetical protein